MGTTVTLGAIPTTVRVRGTKSIARYLPAVARVAMGLPFFIVGLNGLLNFLPQPTTPMPEGATAFVVALMNTGYMLPLISVTQLVVGALLLSNRFVPLALALIAPFFVNSIAFHLFLEPTGLPFAGFFVAIEIYLVRTYWSAFRPMLASHAAQGA